jgi:hypothetical protein
MELECARAVVLLRISVLFFTLLDYKYLDLQI